MVLTDGVVILEGWSTALCRLICLIFECIIEFPFFNSFTADSFPYYLAESIIFRTFCFVCSINLDSFYFSTFIELISRTLSDLLIFFSSTSIYPTSECSSNIFTNLLQSSFKSVSVLVKGFFRSFSKDSRVIFLKRKLIIEVMFIGR